MLEIRDVEVAYEDLQAIWGVSMEVADMPAMGSGFWYLVRAVNCGGAGTYDSGSSGQVGSRDPGLAASPFACP